ncbi:MAG: anti-sigma factor family protein [Bacillota bacterium]
MNCEKASRLLSAYLDHELTPEERRLLRLHLLACAECNEELRQLEAIKGSLGRLSVTSVPSFLPWLRSRLAEEEESLHEEDRPTFVWQQPWFRRTCAAVAFLLLFGLGSWLLSPQRQKGPSTPQNGLPSLPEASWVKVERSLFR